MKILYRLLTSVNVGNRIGNEPLLIDVDAVIQLSFYLSSAKAMTGDYYALLSDNNGSELKKIKITDGLCDIPQSLIRSQIIHIDVVRLDGSKVAARWDCGLIKLTTLADGLKYKLTFYQSVEEISNRLTTCETLINTLIEKIAALESQSVEAFKASILQQLTDIVNSHNKLVEEVAQIKSELSL